MKKTNETRRMISRSLKALSRKGAKGMVVKSGVRAGNLTAGNHKVGGGG